MNRGLIFILILLAVGALFWRFPYAVRDEASVRYFIYLMVWMGLMVFGARAARREDLPKHVRDAAIWGCIVLVLVLGYSFKDRLLGELMPQQAFERADGTIEVRAAEGGHFYIEAKVNGVHTRFMVDTGASDIVLGREDAQRAGINTDSLVYDRSYNTANGYGSGAGVMIDHFVVGTLSMSHLPASVNKVDMDVSLLGMSFLKRFRSFRVEGNTLVLIP